MVRSGAVVLRHSPTELRESEEDHILADTVKVTEATLTYVATDESRKPRQIPPLPASGRE